MNFTFKVVASPDSKFGAIQPDGSWNGMIGELLLDNGEFGTSIYSIPI